MTAAEQAKCLGWWVSATLHVLQLNLDDTGASEAFHDILRASWARTGYRDRAAFDVDWAWAKQRELLR